MAISVRHTIVLREEDKLGPHLYNVTTESVRVDGRLHECLASRQLPEGLVAKLAELQTFEIVVRYDADHGDLLLGDAPLGTTVIVRGSEGGSALATAISAIDEVLNIELQELFQGSAGVATQGHEPQAVYFSSEKLMVSNPGSLSQILKLCGSSRQDTLQIAIAWDRETQKLEYRRISDGSGTIIIEKDDSVDAELGIIQRVQRSLDDSQYEGISTFLNDFSPRPFMIFFDQQHKLAHPTQAFEASISSQGSHLLYSIIINQSRNANTNCDDYILIHLPREYFFDEFELPNVHDGQFNVYGEKDLEKPRWLTEAWGSIFLMKLALSEGTQSIDLPIHARYIEPSDGRQHVQVGLPAPHVYTVCHKADAAFSDNPWHRRSFLEVEFGPTAQLYAWHYTGPEVLYASLTAYSSLEINVILAGTTATILLGFLYCVVIICLKMRSAVMIRRSKLKSD